MAVFEGIVHSGSVLLPADADLPDGTVVRVEPVAKRTFADLREFAGSWQGDDADSVVAEVYRSRSSAPPRAGLE